jgi:hypothetical protein
LLLLHLHLNLDSVLGNIMIVTWYLVSVGEWWPCITCEESSSETAICCCVWDRYVIKADICGSWAAHSYGSG